MFRSCFFAARGLAALIVGYAAWALATPTIVQAAYGFDLAWNAAGYRYDVIESIGGNAFAVGSRHVQLPNGNIVVAGRMRLANDTVQPYWNIGLALYNRRGENTFWNGGGPYLWSNSRYVVYPNLPNGGAGDARIVSVDDVAYADGKIYVLVTRVFSESPLDHDVALVVFNEDGTFRQNLSVILSNFGEFGKALDVKATNLVAKPVAVTILARRDLPSGPRMVVAKFDQGTNGLLAADTGFNGGAALQVPVSLSCAGSGGCNLGAEDLARPSRIGGGDGMPIYAVGAVQRAGANWDYAIVKLTPSGALDSGFGLGGVSYVPFDDPGSDQGDFPSSIQLESSGLVNPVDTVYVAGDIHRSCKDGIGIVGLRSDGIDLGGFGTNGRVLYGGSTETGTLCAQETAHYARALTRQGGELAIAGYAESPTQAGPVHTDGMLMRLDIANGALLGIDALPALPDGSPDERVGRARLRSITPAGNAQYMVAGELTDVPGVGFAYISARLQPADRIYADGFDVAAPEQ